MARTEITVESRIDKRVFSDFSSFNAFYLHNRHITLAVFPILMIALGIINGLTGSTPLLLLFCGAGLLLPALYLLFYRVSLRQQIAANALDTPRLAYTVRLDASGVAVSSSNEQARYKWAQVYRIYARNAYLYIYITKARAFILPYADLQDGATEAELLALVSTRLEPIRFFDRRPRAK